MERLQKGQRVFDIDCKKFGTVLQCISSTTVAVRYDHFLGEEIVESEIPVEYLKLAKSGGVLK